MCTRAQAARPSPTKFSFQVQEPNCRLSESGRSPTFVTPSLALDVDHHGRLVAYAVDRRLEPAIPSAQHLGQVVDLGKPGEVWHLVHPRAHQQPARSRDALMSAHHRLREDVTPGPDEGAGTVMRSPSMLFDSQYSS